MFYSKSTGGFYVPEIHGINMPFDAVEITAEYREALAIGESFGKKIVGDENGFPVLIDPIPPVSNIPTSVTMRQARLALLNNGLLSQVETAINLLPEPQKTQARIEWDYSSVVLRNQPIVLLLAAAIGISEAQMDELFVEGALL